jgi:hypothetical protein
VQEYADQPRREESLEKRPLRTDGDAFDESIKTGAIDSTCIHANRDLEAKREALDSLAEQMPPEKLQRVAETLSSDEIEVSGRTDRKVTVPE